MRREPILPSERFLGIEITLVAELPQKPKSSNSRKLSCRPAVRGECGFASGSWLTSEFQLFEQPLSERLSWLEVQGTPQFMHRRCVLSVRPQDNG